MSTSLAEVLGETKDAGPQQPVVAAKETEPKSEANRSEPKDGRDDKGRFVPKETTRATEDGAEDDRKPASEPAEEKPKPTIPASAQEALNTDERRKRQRLEEENRQLREQMARLSRPPQPQRPDPIADPEGAQQYDREQYQSSLVDMKVDMSWEIAASTIRDFDAVMNDPDYGWRHAAQEDPTLYQRAIQSQNPAKFAYQAVKRSRFMRDVGDNPDDYKARLRKEIEAEFAAKAPAVQPAAPLPPKSLADANSAPAPKPGEWTGPTPLKDILKPNSKR